MLSYYFIVIASVEIDVVCSVVLAGHFVQIVAIALVVTVIEKSTCPF
jgi:hypothetical protein